MRMFPLPRKSAPLLLILALLSIPTENTVQAQQVALSQEAYLTPPKEIADAVLASNGDMVALTNLSPDGRKFLIAKTDGMPTLQRMACPCVYLAEMAFDPVACRSRALWIRSGVGYDLYYHADKRTVPVQVPEHARVSNAVWSPDGSKLAFYALFDDATHIYIADTETGFSRKLTSTPVLATLETSFQWSKDGKQVETVLLPDDGKRPMPRQNGVATEPKVRITRGGNHPSRTYRYLLESPYDMKLLEHLATGQLALIDINDGKVTRIGFPNLIRTVSMAPGEQQFRVTTIKKPFSYFVPFTNFGSHEGIWDCEGKCLYTVLERNLRDSEPPPPAPTLVAAAQTGTPGAGRGGRQGRAATPPLDPAQPQPPPNPDPDPNPDADPFRRTPPPDPNDKRDIVWRPDGAGLSYLQLEPAKKDAKEPRKDRVYQWRAPFGKDDARVLYETAQRITNLQYSEDCKLLFLTQTIDSQRQISAIDVADPKKPIYVVYKSPPAGGTGAPAANPPAPTAGESAAADSDDEQPLRGGRGFRGGAGPDVPSLMTRAGRGTVPVVRLSSTADVYVSGADRVRGDANAVSRPYIDRINIKTGKKARIFAGKGDMIETIDAVDGDDVKLVFTTRQKKDVVPDSYVTDLQSNKTTKLTNNVDRAPWYHQLKVERIQTTRVDGFKFWVKVTTPAKAAGKLPALFWIYPREYADQAAYNRGAARTLAASQRFDTPGPRSMTLLTLLGYAVVEPDVPIVGPAGRINDNYIPDLRNSLWAVIDELDKRGIIDRDRLAVGGHSYGAFSTANALAHTPFFKAGIAGDGNYNRTLTTMTFQTERRQIWEARETYLEMSPLLWANRVNGALLMYHGMNDANVGTNPINAEHMFMALDGLGKPAALYMYPYEGHGPIARETTLDQWARWVAWLDTYVKKAKKEEKKPEAPPIARNTEDD
ncbi:MAG TPA: prolyl oligopeptidase family serine peptidase [Gemmataceae bacterium]|nr:prolyl oligopeptidase family serine peptidase [Gemmataceae bacterium]